MRNRGDAKAGPRNHCGGLISLTTGHNLNRDNRKCGSHWKYPMPKSVDLLSPEMVEYKLNDHGPLKTNMLFCEGFDPCVVRSNKAGQIVWAHLRGTKKFYLAYRLAGNCWTNMVVGVNTPSFAPICTEMGQ